MAQVVRVDGVVDIETEDWVHFVLGGLLSHDGTFHVRRCEEEFFDLLLSHGGQLWAWNGGRYDWNWFLEKARVRGLSFQMNLAGSQITRATSKGIVLRDAMALYPVALKKAARVAGIELAKDTGLPCRCRVLDKRTKRMRAARGEEQCGGYCSIKVGMPEKRYKRLTEYLRADCEATMQVLETLQTEAERCGYSLAGTVGASSYRSAARMLDLPPAEWESHVYRACRDGLFGGRTEVFAPNVEAEGFAYDINSAYPAALTRLDLPVGEPIPVAKARAEKAFARGLEGIFRAEVTVPRDTFLPPLPWRLPSGRVAYPVGTFRGTWTALELRGAIADGATVRVISGYAWAESEPVFRPYMEHVWGARARAREEKNEALAGWHKFVGNSCYGKLAEAPEKERVFLHPMEPHLCEGHLEERAGNRRCTGKAGCKECDMSKCCRRKCSNRCGSYRPIDDAGHVWVKPLWQISDCGHVHWAAYLTSWTRTEWRRQAQADGKGGLTMVYGDTDSVYCTAPRTHEIGPELGQWGEEGRWRRFYAVAPKAYLYECLGCKDHPRGGSHVKAKGLSRITVDEFKAFAAGKPHVVNTGVLGLKSAARTGKLFQRKRLERRNLADGRVFGSRVLADDGRTYPLDARELAKWT
jgi:hypothetical protein